MMAEAGLYLLLDQGGQSSRAMVMDPSGAVLATAREPISSDESADGRVEQDGQAIRDSLVAAIGQVAQTLGQASRHLVAAGLAVQRGSVLCWRPSTGQALTPVLSWRDRRLPHHPSPDPDLVRETTGLRFSPYGGAGKLRWCLESLPEVEQALLDQDLAMGPLGSYLLQALLSERPLAVDPSLAQRTLLYDRHHNQWSDALLNGFGIPPMAMPTITASRETYGRLSVGGVTTPLQLLMGDQNAVPWAAGPPKRHHVTLNLGTGAFMLRPVDADQAPGPFQFSLLDPAQSPGFALEASIHGAGAALQWFARQTGQRPSHQEIEASFSIPRPALFINTVGGLGSPWWQAGPEPDFVDHHGTRLDPKQDRAQCLAGLMESLCFLIRVNLETMDELAGPSEAVNLAGGLSRSRALCRHLAALLPCPVYRLNNPEATSTGLWRQLSSPRLQNTPKEKITAQPITELEGRFQAWLQFIQQSLN